jgi:uncharacterized protein (TIGR00730 family)
MKSLCVFCASKPGTDPRYLDLATSVGRSLAGKGITLVYGGGRVGLMGAMADAALAARGRVIGVMPRQLMERELGHSGLTDLHIVESLSERKSRLVDLADATVALPGGIGTLDELFEAWTWQYLGVKRKPCALLNAFSYYDPLLRFLDQAVAAGFVPADARSGLIVEGDWDRLLEKLAAATGT